jgi:hypothetical protein
MLAMTYSFRRFTSIDEQTASRKLLLRVPHRTLEAECEKAFRHVRRLLTSSGVFEAREPTADLGQWNKCL